MKYAHVFRKTCLHRVYNFLPYVPIAGTQIDASRKFVSFGYHRGIMVPSKLLYGIVLLLLCLVALPQSQASNGTAIVTTAGELGLALLDDDITLITIKGTSLSPWY